jgi:cytochrome bd ubiquinol oxidase subunit II
MLGRDVSGSGTGWNCPLVAAANRARAADGLRAARRLRVDQEDRGRAARACGALSRDRLGAPMVGGLVLTWMASPWISATVQQRGFVLPAQIALIALSAILLVTGVAACGARAAGS